MVVFLPLWRNYATSTTNPLPRSCRPLPPPPQSTRMTTEMLPQAPPLPHYMYLNQLISTKSCPPHNLLTILFFLSLSLSLPPPPPPPSLSLSLSLSPQTTCKPLIFSFLSLILLEDKTSVLECLLFSSAPCSGGACVLSLKASIPSILPMFFSFWRQC